MRDQFFCCSLTKHLNDRFTYDRFYWREKRLLRRDEHESFVQFGKWFQTNATIISAGPSKLTKFVDNRGGVVLADCEAISIP
jgi:hypothetical protein